VQKTLFGHTDTYRTDWCTWSTNVVFINNLNSWIMGERQQTTCHILTVRRLPSRWWRRSKNEGRSGLRIPHLETCWSGWARCEYLSPPPSPAQTSMSVLVNVRWPCRVHTHWRVTLSVRRAPH